MSIRSDAVSVIIAILFQQPKQKKKNYILGIVCFQVYPIITIYNK